MKRLTNPFEQPGRWYKANLHTHTTVSDGRLSPAERVAQYREGGYAVLAMTDHFKTNDVRGMSDKKMLVISGIEYHPPCPTTPMAYHIVGLNVPHSLAFDDPDDANRCIAQVARAGGESILAHPYWSGQAHEDFRNLSGLAAMEIYNSTCDNTGRPASESEWSYCLDHGQVIPIVGSDDVHAAREGDVFGCWSWLKLRSVTVANVLKAVRSGACYASCGPKIHDFRISDGKVRLRCSPAAKIHFKAGPSQGARRRADEGKSITSFSIDVRPWPYVRAVVTDHTGNCAWTNPIYL